MSVSLKHMKQSAMSWALLVVMAILAFALFGHLGVLALGVLMLLYFAVLPLSERVGSGPVILSLGDTESEAKRKRQRLLASAFGLILVILGFALDPLIWD